MLKLTLHASSYDWASCPSDGETFTDCRHEPGQRRRQPRPGHQLGQHQPDQPDDRPDRQRRRRRHRSPTATASRYTYQWTKNGIDIAGATGSTLNLATAGNGDRGDVIRVRVTGQRRHRHDRAHHLRAGDGGQLPRRARR